MSGAARRLQRGEFSFPWVLEERRFYLPKEARVTHEQGTCFQDVRNIINVLMAATRAGFRARKAGR